MSAKMIEDEEDYYENVVEEENVQETAESIYNKLGNVTESNNVTVPYNSPLDYSYKDFMDEKIPEFRKNNDGIVAFRTQNNNFLEAYKKNNDVGNPFSSGAFGLIQNVGGDNTQEEKVKEAVVMFIQWITGDIQLVKKLTKKELSKLAELRSYRKALQDDLKSGKFKGKSILYYKELNQPSHATALDYLINKYDWDSKLSMSDFVNHSGGAYGGDTYWDLVGREFGVIQHKHYRDKENAKLSKKLKDKGVKATVLSKEEMDFARQKVFEILGKNYPNNTMGNLQVRNFYQVYNADSVFAIASLKNDKKNVAGGTNTAVQLGIKLNKPVFVWDIETEQWYSYKTSNNLFNDSTSEIFIPIETPVLTKNFAGIGSRDIEGYNVFNKQTGKWAPREKYVGKDKENAAKQAIRDVYANTKNSLKSSNTQQPLGKEVKKGVWINQQGLSKDEQIEIFEYLKPLIETQAAKTNKGSKANKMMGLGLRWDYFSTRNSTTVEAAGEASDGAKQRNAQRITHKLQVM